MRTVLILAAVVGLLIPVSAQNAQAPTDWSKIAGNFGDVKVLSNGGPAPRMTDGRPDLRSLGGGNAGRRYDRD